MSKPILMTMTAIALLLAAPAFADHHMEGEKGGHKGKMMDNLDTDADGNVSKEEFIEAHSKRFEEMDADGDGSISKEEIKARHDVRREEMQAKRADWEDKSEERRQKRFEEMDADGDGSISKEEMDAAHEKWRDKRKERHEKKGAAEE